MSWTINFKLLQLSSWLKGLKEWHIQEAVSGCLIQVDFQLFSGHFSLVRSGWLDHCRTSQWKIKMKYALFRSFFCCCHCFFWKNYHSPSCTLLRICRSGWIVWIKCEILIIDVGNHEVRCETIQIFLPQSKDLITTRQTISIYWILTVCPVLWKEMIIKVVQRENIAHYLCEIHQVFFQDT